MNDSQKLKSRSYVGFAVVTLALAVGVTGCSGLKRVLRFKDQTALKRQVARIEGRIDTEGPSQGTLVVLLGKDGETSADPIIGIDTFIRLRPGMYAFPAAAGTYRLGAYEDRNGNGLLDPDERVVLPRDSPAIEVVPGEKITHDITIMKGAVIPGLKEPFDVLGLVERTPKEQRDFSLWAWSVEGEVAPDLGDARFGPKAGTRGLWEIVDFLNSGDAGIYFVEPYDPKRIPVLFVHGIGGYPREFSSMFDELDRERFQPWFYFYPSGFALDGISNHLAILLERLQAKHDFGEFAVVAHSMGGLVSRGAVLKYTKSTGRNDVRLFVSVSTPWGGDVKAKRADEAPIELPSSFSDMSPSSDYLKWLFYQTDGTTVRRLPKGAEYHLLFGYRMNSSSRVADDGTVTLASQLRSVLQEQAVTQRGYDEGHTDILHAPAVIDRVNLLLDQRFD